MSMASKRRSTKSKTYMNLRATIDEAYQPHDVLKKKGYSKFSIQRMRRVAFRTELILNSIMRGGKS